MIGQKKNLPEPGLSCGNLSAIMKSSNSDWESVYCPLYALPRNGSSATSHVQDIGGRHPPVPCTSLPLWIDLSPPERPTPNHRSYALAPRAWLLEAQTLKGAGYKVIVVLVDSPVFVA
jgi:hypothetical protein